MSYRDPLIAKLRAVIATATMPAAERAKLTGLIDELERAERAELEARDDAPTTTAN